MRTLTDSEQGSPRHPSERDRQDTRDREHEEELETAPIPGPAKGDDDTLVEIDNPDDVDLYRHGSPPPGFRRATLKPPVPAPDLKPGQPPRKTKH